MVTGARVLQRFYQEKAASESADLAQQIKDLLSAIEKAQRQASKAEASGQLGRADGLRSKIRDYRQKLERAEHVMALDREAPFEGEGSK
jgi:hypothetical protein